jgi:tetratricopeptide (TPR) repeat protein
VAGTEAVTANKALHVARLGHAKLLAEHTGQAAQLAMRALDAARTYGERGHEAWALYLLADVAATASDYGRALALAQSLGMCPLIAHCHAALGTLHRRLGDPDEARDHLSRAKKMFEETGMQTWRRTVVAALEDDARRS